MRDLLPAEGRSRATFTIDQANVGGDAVSNLRLALARSQDKLKIEELRSACRAAAAASCRASSPACPRRRPSTAASACAAPAWCASSAGRRPTPLTFDAKGDGTFGIRSQLSIAPGHARRAQSVGDLSGTAVRGGAHYRWEGRPELSLLVESPQLDARAFIPAGAEPRRHPRRHPAWPPRARAQRRLGRRQAGLAQRPDRHADPRQHRAAHHRLAHLPRRRDGDRAQGRPPQACRSSGAGDDGFSLELEGEVDNAATRPKGILRGVIGAETAQAIAPLAELLGIPDAFVRAPSAGAGHGAAQAGGIDVARRAHADLDRPGARRRGRRRHRQAQRAVRWRRRRVAHGARRC